MALGPEGIEAMTDLTFTQNRWDTVSAVSESPKAVLLWLGALIAMPVPDDALPDGVDRAELLRRIEQWRGEGA